MKQIFRWVDGDDVHEYRFTDGVCDGFFTNDQKKEVSKLYDGKPITDHWLANLPAHGFKEITS